MSAARPGLLLTARYYESHRDAVDGALAAGGLDAEVIVIAEPPTRLDPDLLLRIELAFFSGEWQGPTIRAFFGAALRAPRLRWMHLSNAGTDAEVFARLLERGVVLTNSSGASATPIAHSLIGGLLALSRGFPRWAELQRKREWSQRSSLEAPRDLAGQTLVVFGLGAIGSEVARIARALGLRVVGLRRSPRRDGDPVDELRPPEALVEVAAQADWLAVCCPLTDETRGAVSREVIAAMPPGAHLLNVARGAIVDEAALIEALEAGRLGGAYLDVFATEPLPPGSPLWRLPSVIVSPHDSSSSDGSAERASEIFLCNLERYGRGETLENRVQP